MPIAQNPARMLRTEAPLPVSDGAAIRPEALREAEKPADLQACTRCPLYLHATQAVPGEGPPSAALMFVGEQPGDREDVSGRPFVGPAGKVLEAAFQRLGLERKDVYLTNAVKHFKFEPRGKRRLHKAPDAGEIVACRIWLDEERAKVRPRVIVALGASAARAVLGRAVTIGTMRGRPHRLADGAQLVVTIHPAFLLRLRDAAQKRAEWQSFLADLRLAAGLVAAQPEIARASL